MTDKFKGLIGSASLNRRQFSTMAAAGAAVSTIGTAAMPAFADMPKRGGRFRFGWTSSGADDTMNPELMTSANDYLRSYLTYNMLVRYAPDGSALPDLAESWEVNDDATEWVFTLRDGVEFHNGKTLTAQDVIYSLNLHRGEDTASAIKGYLEPVTEMTADGPLKVSVKLSGPNADFATLLGQPQAAIVPDGYTDFANAIGTGPFKQVRFEPGLGYLGERNENYFIEGKPYFDEVEVIGIEDTQARINALLTGDVNYINRVGAQSSRIIDRSPNTTLVSVPSKRVLGFPMMIDRDPTSSLDLRLAIRNLIKRESMLNDIHKGFGVVGNDVPIAPFEQYYNSDLPQREFDLDKAKFHLKKAGMENATIDLDTSLAVDATAPDMALHLKESAAEAGLTININRKPTDGYWSSVWLTSPFNMVTWNPRPTPDGILTIAYMSDAKWNENALNFEDMDKLIVEARGTVDGPARAELYHEVQRILWERGGSALPVFTNWLDGHSANMRGHTGNPTVEGDSYRIAEYAWFA